MSLKNLLLILCACCLTACAFHQAPYVMHDATVATSNTAVFASFDQGSAKYNDSRIRSVDGKETSCAQAGCPFWVRTQPGKHVFSVRYTSNFGWNLNGSSFSYVDFQIEVPDMKPRHVYVVRYQEVERRVQFVVEDLGENPNFGIRLGLEGVNNKYYPVKF